MTTRHLLLALAALLAPLPAAAQTHSGFPVNIAVPQPPAPVLADGHQRLVYELQITNFYAGAIEVAGIEVVAGEKVLASWRGAALNPLLMAVGPVSAPGAERVLEGGRTAIAFLDITLENGMTAPPRLHHRLVFAVKTGSGETVERTVEGIALTVASAPPVIGPPLRGGRWVAANGLFAPDHRRSYNAVDGEAHLAQRFAIDWVKLGPDGRFFAKDPAINADYAGYGADVIAVADGRVAAVKSGFADNPGSTPVESRAVTLDSITGNAVLLDLGGGRFALYAHLQPGSIAVAPGERVKTGQVIARLGNTGNSDAPHLHFQLMDAASPLGAEGIPYALDGFTQEAVLPDLAALDTGQPWQAPKGEAVQHRGEFPVDRAVVSFP